ASGPGVPDPGASEPRRGARTQVADARRRVTGDGSRFGAPGRHRTVTVGASGVPLRPPPGGYGGSVSVAPAFTQHARRSHAAVGRGDRKLRRAGAPVRADEMRDGRVSME